MKTFVLIHGSWHGAWNWHRIKPILEKQGHRVYAFDLPGMGRDKTPIKDVKMNDTVAGVVDLINNIDGKVILMGHSKNGIIISQVAEFVSHKIEKLVYLAAYLVPNGRYMREYSLADTEGVLKPFVTFHESLNATTLGKEIFLEGLYEDCPDIVELADVLLCPEPLESALTPLQLTEENYGSVPRVYIECLRDKAVSLMMQRKMYSEMPCEKVYSMDTSHSPFFSRPQELADILSEIANAN